MAAYGVIGGFIGGAIALAITPMLIKRAKKRYNKKEHKEPKSYRPWGVALFLFIGGLWGVSVGPYVFVLTINSPFSYKWFILLGLSLFITISGILTGCWSGSFLGARITIAKERLVIDYAAKMSNNEDAKIHLWQLGRHHLDLRWEKIRELRADRNFMQIVLYNDERYMFPIGWCKEDARFAVERHKKIKPWE